MSASQIETLVRMVNQISSNLSAYPAEEAAERAAAHLKRFWAPQMRTRLIEEAHLHPDGLLPVSQLAVEKLAQLQSAKTS